MQPQNQPIAQTPEIKRCSHLPIIIVLVILLASSLSFGIYEYVQNLRKDDEIAAFKKDQEEKNEASEPADEEENVEYEFKTKNILEGIESFIYLDVEYSSVEFDRNKCQNCRNDSEYSFSNHYREILTDAEEHVEYNVDFGVPVMYTYRMAYGHDGVVSLYVLENGDAGYTSYENNNFLYGIISDLHDVVGFKQGYSGGGSDIFAILENGEYYSIKDWLLENTFVNTLNTEGN